MFSVFVSFILAFLCHAFLSGWGFQKRIDCLVYFRFFFFFFFWPERTGTGRNWVHILGIWGLFKLVNIRWFFYVLFIYISGLFHYYRYGWRVLSLYFFFADFSFDRLLEKKKKKQNKTKVVVCCFDSQNIHTCTAVSMFPLLYLLDKSSSPPLQLPPSSTTQLMPYCF